MNEERKIALKSIYDRGWGYFKDLQDTIGKEILAEFVSVGFIICGYTRRKKTWRISNLGRSYAQDLDIA